MLMCGDVPTPGVAIGQLAGFALGVVDELTHILGWHRRIDDQNVRSRGHDRDRREVVHRIVVDLLVEHRIERQRARHHQQRVAIGRRAGDRLDADHVAGAGAVLHEELLLERGREMLR